MERRKPQVVVLCGGHGTRIREYPELIPKAMVPLGNRPLLLHILRSYAHFGFDDFILCLGYRSDVIRQYFLNFSILNRDVTVNLGSGQTRVEEFLGKRDSDWKVTLVDTGLQTTTGGRLRQVLDLIKSDRVFIAYGDCLTDLDFGKQLDFHERAQAEITVTGIKRRSRFGHIEAGQDGKVASFEEKPVLRDFVSGGFFIAEREFISRIDSDTALEAQPLELAARAGRLYCYRHEGFWACMDTYRDYEELNELCNRDEAPWIR